ncbi:hypothetical protein AVEN_6247-1 [Araneus ventricosus]|uniref:Uncharacterized protein n=1 Tax=Araneus ventricosus TaxID=182803 RepID=A0A4Y2GLU4_ARAVE|nr:hypothetical protein AVEN_6247-1 [Araneus ventricosus]
MLGHQRKRVGGRDPQFSSYGLPTTRSHGPCFGARIIGMGHFALSSVVGSPRIAVARGFVGWLDRSGEMSVNSGSSKEASRRTGTSVQFVRATYLPVLMARVSAHGPLEWAISPYLPLWDRQESLLLEGLWGGSTVSVNARTSKEASWRTGTSVQFLRAIADRVCVAGTVLLVKFRPAINPRRRKWIAEELIMGRGL